MRIFTWIIALVAMALAAGCGSHGPRSVSDPDPADKIPAIETAARLHDRRVIPQLVMDLESDDPAVRMFAIDGLRRLTGEDLGYQYFLDDDARKPCVELWKQWLAKHPQ